MKQIVLSLLLMLGAVVSQADETKKLKEIPIEYNTLTPEEEYVILRKGTERPFGTNYEEFQAQGAGTYVCRQCDNPLYSTDSKFDSHCGWPSFDDEIEGAVKHLPDADGSRVEIVCSNCGGHLGHVFKGERMTAKNTRHCVNYTSIKFIPKVNK